MVVIAVAAGYWLAVWNAPTSTVGAQPHPARTSALVLILLIVTILLFLSHAAVLLVPLLISYAVTVMVRTMLRRARASRSSLR